MASSKMWCRFLSHRQRHRLFVLALRLLSRKLAHPVPCTNVSDELGRGLYGKYMPLIRIQAPQRYHWINTAPRINVDWLRVQAPTLLFSAL